ncbi:MAG: alcohol dehydrogenase catalytic domain-containing protein [Propionibacteriaceae bacterium]|jgi:threonine dehydrogenase-like Zn-dependent dehydrogenase|nr:alcohol dehydrogenase catalytic domain-containing protein [Propionibacteriaceae bacterium]
MTTQYAVQITAKDQIEINPALPVPAVGPTQILLKIEACGICFSDTKLMHTFADHPRKLPILAGITAAELAEIPTYRPGAAPIVPGHEPVARVAQVGERVTRYTVGQRVLVQTDYRHLPTAKANAAFGYDFDGALEEYALVDERMVIDPVTGESFLIPVDETPSASAVALIEPWACVETAYAWPERPGLKPGGTLLVVVDDGYVPVGLEELVAAAQPARRVDNPAAGRLADELFDDIIYVGASAERVEALSRVLGARGIMNIVTCGRAFDRDVAIDVGRVHYDLIRYVGTTGDRPADGYAWSPATCELRPGEALAVIGAAGPMGLMHTVRAATAGVPGITVDAVDVDDHRLGRLHAVVDPIAAAAGVPVRVINSATTPLTEGAYTYVALMVPVPALLRQAIGLAGAGAIVNAFAGFAVGTTADLDLNAILARRIYLFGTSGSRICDMVTVKQRLEAGVVDTNISLDAISGIAGVPDAIESVTNRTSQGKIMVYPALHDLGLVRLVDLPGRLPAVAAAMADGRWTKAAEQVLLESAS